MPTPTTTGTRHDSGLRLWEAAAGNARILFVGRGPRWERRRLLDAVTPPDLSPAWADQVHSATVLAAAPGACGRGDALVTDRRGLALSIAVADCVPVAVGGGASLAVIHAGWRGIVAGVVAATAARLAPAGGDLEAWIGPAIGRCCYEVGEEVAHAVARASAAEVALRAPGRKPRLDLQAAVELQLRKAGIGRLQTLRLCTRCHPELLWSYRLEGRAAGRNLLVAWLRD